jgi:D-xylonolactonase
VYDYAVAGGICSERHIWQEMSAEQVALHGRSDGMTVDQAGNVWSARIEAGLVIQYDSSGRELRRFSFPARRVTSVAFGGPDLSDLYVTSAGGASRSEEGSSAGALFCLKGVAQGKSEFRSRLGS